MPKTASREPSPLSPYTREHDPRWVRVAHKLSGTIVLIAVLTGVVLISLLRLSPDAFNTAIALATKPLGVGGVIVVVSAAIFQALNSIRLAIVDLTTWGAEAESGRAAAFLPIVVVLWLAITAAAAYGIGEYTAAEMWGTR